MRQKRKNFVEGAPSTPPYSSGSIVGVAHNSHRLKTYPCEGRLGGGAPPAKSLFSPFPAPLGFQPSTGGQGQAGEGLKQRVLWRDPLHTSPIGISERRFGELLVHPCARVYTTVDNSLVDIL